MTAESISATALAVQNGAVSAEEVTRAALERCERSQEVLNAFTSIDHDGAIGRARAVDASVADGTPLGPLTGVPVAVKDLIEHKGQPNTRGSSAAPLIPDVTAPSIARLEAAGAVVIGRTGLHEYAFGFSSENHWHGPVRNPWDVTLSPGGSSGGSAAAAAAGLVAAALGTDTGGSVRVPAALCGIVGLKVTHGRVPLRGVYPLAPSLDTVGPLARSVADCAAIYEVIAGDDQLDPWSVPQPVDPLGTPADLSALTIGVPHPWADEPVVPQQRAAFEQFLSSVSDEGARVVTVDVPQLAPSGQTLTGLFFEAAQVHRRRFTADPAHYGPEVRERIAAAMEITGDEYLAALEWRRGTRAAAMRALQTVDVLVTPTVAALRKPIGVNTVDIGGEKVHYVRAESVFATLVNHIGLPALALPLPGDSKPPPSLQIIGRAWSETRLLEVGLALEKAGSVSTQTPPRWRPGTIAINP